MSSNHRVQQGDSISSLGLLYGFSTDALWAHPKNAELRKQRVDGECLMAGDEVFIPDKQVASHICATTRRHTFQRKSVPAKFEVRLLSEGKPRANIPWELSVNGAVLRRGVTDADGWIRTHVMPDVQRAQLSVGKDGDETYPIAFGHLDPWDSISGVQARLRNLGILAEAPTGQLDAATRDAVRAFQVAHSLPALPDDAEKIDARTVDTIRAAHGA
jgi:Putative peptidoglycan binding domain